MKRFLASLSLLPLLACAAGSEATDTDSTESELAAAPTSAYTSLESNDCQDLTEPFMTWEGSQLCKPMGEFAAIVHSGDGRQNIVVRTKNGERDLSVWSELPAFGSLGPKAEWRGKFVAPGKVDPYALIFRYSQSSFDGESSTSHLVVARITRDAACIVGVVDGNQANGNVKARELADAKRDFRCPAEKNGQITSAYTSLERSECSVLHAPTEPEDGGSLLCDGMGEYQTVVATGDSRQNVYVRSFTGGEYDMGVWNALPAFGHLGPNAEWRGYFVESGRVDPYALVFRYITGNKHYLFVTKLTSTRPCVKAIVDVSRHPNDANVIARRLADDARTQACPAQRPTPQ